MYPYMWFCQPPGPAFSATVSWKGHSYPCHALIDTGADQTYLPAPIARALRLIARNNNITMRGVGGSGGRGSLYVVNIALSHSNVTVFDLQNIPVISDNSFSQVLLGRDIINDYEITLDGPNRRFSIVKP